MIHYSAITCVAVPFLPLLHFIYILIALFMEALQLSGMSWGAHNARYIVGRLYAAIERLLMVFMRAPSARWYLMLWHTRVASVRVLGPLRRGLSWRLQHSSQCDSGACC